MMLKIEGTMKLNLPGVAAAKTRSSANRFSAILLAAFVAIISVSAAGAQKDAKRVTPAETWVVSQATAGEIADLSKKFPAEKDRKLRADFLEDLVTGALPGFKPHRNGVRVMGAIIDNPIKLANAQIPCEVWLEHCQFKSTASLVGANFYGSASFEGSKFMADASFASMKVGKVASFNDAVFEGPVTFFSAEVTGFFSAQGTKFQNQQQGASFNSMKVGGGAFFDNAVFD